jgi:drug/metabolite transporter (DMT)-like permease
MRPPPDSPSRGILLILAATMIFSIADTIAKLLTADLAAVQINWTRYLVSSIMALAISVRSPGHPFRAVHPKIQLVRGLCVTCSSLLFVLAISVIPLAEAASIGFAAPLVVTILSIPLLGEIVGIRRWAAVGAGFLGVLIVLRPGSGAFQLQSLFALAGACTWALALVLTRRMAGTMERGATTMLWSSVTGLAILSMMLPFHFRAPGFRTLALLLLMSVLGSAGQWLVILAHRHGPASTLAPIFYIQLLWTTLGGYLAFSAIPDHWTFLGASIIIGSGLYTAHRERARARERRRDTSKSL